MRSFTFPEELVPLPQHLNIIAQFTVSYLPLQMLSVTQWKLGICYASVHGMHI